MNEKPILFNTEMVKAILGGRKTVTRRLFKGDIREFGNNVEFFKDYPDGTSVKTRMARSAFIETYAPFKAGDTLYVRETWCRGTDIWGCKRTSPEYFYKADDNSIKYKESHNYWKEPKWHPSIHMPKEAARIFLKVTDVQIGRLQDIDGKEAEAEGAAVINNPFVREIKDTYDAYGRNKFSSLWDSTINAKEMDKYGWDANPWVWIIRFERTK